MTLGVPMKLTKFLIMFFLSFLANAQDKTTKEEMEQGRIKQNQEYIALLNKQKELAEPVLDYDIAVLEAALRIKVIKKYDGAAIISVNPFTEEYKYLGTISSEFSNDSIFNQFGDYGSEYSQDSIWNEFSQYGGEFSDKSPFNKYSSSPPLIVLNKKVIGHLTVNEFVSGAVDPNWLKTFFMH